MPRLSYIPKSRVHVPVDQYGRPFESKEDQEVFERRERDPEYSHQFSMENYILAVNDLRAYVSNHSADAYSGAVEFVDGLQEKTVAIEDALAQLQFDILRVTEKNNAGWIEAEGPAFRRRSGFRNLGRRRVFRYIGEVPPIDEDELDSGPFAVSEETY